MRIAVISPTTEALEPRRLMSGGLGTDGTLTLAGTIGNDAIYIKAMPTKQIVRVVVNGQITDYPERQIKALAVVLDTGNDLFDATASSIPAWVDAQGGNDTLLGGNGNDFLIGGLDNDSVEGNLGDDTLCGNGGKDRLSGGPGRDRLDGGKSSDILRGGSSNDRLIGGEGADILYGDGGDDRFYSNGMFSDTLYGGSGTDRAYVDRDDILASIELPVFDA